MQEVTAQPSRRWTWPAWRACALAGVAGVAQTLAFAPRDWWWLQLLAMAGWFALIERSASRRQAAWLGGAFGVAGFCAGIWWLYVSMHDYGGMPAAMAGAAVVLFSIYLAIYPALAATLTRMAPATGPWRVLAFAGAVTICEWLRGVMFTGFPWLSPGYAHVDGPLAGFAPIVGVYGMGGLAALTAALMARAVFPVNLAAALRTRVLTLAGALVVVLAGAGAARHAWTSPSGEPLKVRLLQGNVPQDMKFQQATVSKAMRMYTDMIVAAPADVIVTPETAFPVLLPLLPRDLGMEIREFADRTGSHVLVGALGVTPLDNGENGYTNSLFGVTPKDTTLHRYDKHHLVPFGEFVPWGFHWFVRMMNIPLGDLLRGSATPEGFPVKGQRIALDICYEDLFGEEIARALRNMDQPATVLANSTNLGWFGDTIALDQHLQIARLRSLETGRPMLRATNTGVTAIIDAQGRVQGRLPSMTIGVLTGNVQPYAGLTPYVRFGNVPPLVLALLALGAALLIGRRQRAA